MNQAQPPNWKFIATTLWELRMFCSKDLIFFNLEEHDLKQVHQFKAYIREKINTKG